MAPPHDDPARPHPFPPLPPETYTYLIHALLSLQGSATPWPPTAGPSSFYPAIPLVPPAPQLAPPSSQSTAQDPEGAEDATSTAEDKRRRNTAASARFRIRKKLKTLNLERTVADLSSRTEELEREASDLRRENTWLKEIVLLKGRNLAALHPGPHDGAEEDHRRQAASALESAVKHRGKEKGKGKEKEKEKDRED